MRLGFPDDATVAAALRVPALAHMNESGALINVYRMLLRSPEPAGALAQLGASLFVSTGIPDEDRELVILICAAVFCSPYEAAQHDALSQSVGVTDDQRTAVARSDWTASCFDARQTALLAFTVAVAQNPQVDEATFATATQHMDERALIDIVVLVGVYFLVTRMTTVLDIPADPPGDDTILKVARAGLS